MRKKKEIVLSVIDALRIKSINEFGTQLGYSNSSGVYNMISEEKGSTSLGFTFVSKIIETFPMVNIDYLNNKSDVIILENYTQKEKAPGKQTSMSFKEDDDMTLMFMIKLYKEQKKTNELLSKLLEK